ncbi:MAG: DUF4190 domain-containing protein [Planctomycetes bacterium]|nr:DUF4190 domain-containing protein [Planctomycetota bacterium]
MIDPPKPHTPRSSVLAMVALAIAVIPCCPLAGLLGACLGIVSLSGIRRSEGRVTGARIAIAAIVLGTVTSIIGWLALDRLVSYQEAEHTRTMDDQVTRIIRSASEQRTDELHLWAAGTARPSDDELLAFGAVVSERYGRFDRLAIISSTHSGPLLSPIREIAVVFHFEHGQPLGSARFQTRVVGGQFIPQLDLARLTIEDAAAGDLVLGGADSGQAATGPP